MSEKLTYQSMIERVRIGLISQLWSDIQADREAIRAEVTASVTEELLKDHFKIGEKVLFTPFDDEVKGVVCAYDMDGLVTSWAPKSCRRPPETRPMTREEKINTLISRMGASWSVDACSTDDGIDAALKLLKITPEVPV